MICVWSADCTDFSTRGNGTKTHNGRCLYSWRKETIERFFAEAKKNHGLRCARLLGIRNMREQCFLNAAVQNMKRLVKAG